MAWWLLFQSWGHRGLEPRNVRCEGGALIAKLTRSKTLGSDKAVSSRLIVVDPEAYFRNKHWAVDGWNFVKAKAPYERDYLPPASSGNYRGVQCRELRYDTAFALQIRLLASLSYRGTELLKVTFPHTWTPHSGRNFLPTAASVQGFPTQDKNFLAGWSAEESERKKRVARYKFSQIQRDVIKIVWDKRCARSVG